MGYYKDLPQWAKGVVAISVIAGVGVTMYFTVKSVKKLADKINQNKDEKDVKNDLKDLNNEPETKQKISDSQAKSFASGLFSAMDGNATDEDAIYSVFTKVKNEADVLAIIKAFGTKSLRLEYLWAFESYKGDLAGCLREELDDSEMSKLNSILTKKGIKFQF